MFLHSFRAGCAGERAWRLIDPTVWQELVEDVDLKAMCKEMKKTLKAAKKSGVSVYQAAGL